MLKSTAECYMMLFDGKKMQHDQWHENEFIYMDMLTAQILDEEGRFFNEMNEFPDGGWAEYIEPELPKVKTSGIQYVYLCPKCGCKHEIDMVIYDAAVAITLECDKCQTKFKCIGSLGE